MKTSPLNCLAGGLALFIVTSPAWAQPHPGSVDFARFSSLQATSVSVDLTLGGWLLSWARIAARESGDPDLEILSNVDSIRVRVFEVSDAAASKASASAVVDELLAQGWERLARVLDEGSWVHVLVKGQEELLEGITVIALDDGDEAVFVNIAGRLHPADVARLLRDKDLLHVDLNVDFET